MTDPAVIDLLSDVDAYLCALHVHVARHDQIGADLTCGGCVLRDRIAAALPQLAAVPPADQTTDRAAILTEAADEAKRVAESLRKHHEFERSTGALDVMTELRRLAAEAQPTTQPDEDPARIDRLRPEFFEHASVESIDLQIQRARRQQRHWGNRERTLAILRQARVTQKERGEWPAAGARQDGAQP